MQENILKKLIKSVIRQKSEKQTVELKSAAKGFPHKIYDTLSAFSNQDNGGIIIFGISEKPEFKVVGVYDLQDIQKQIAESCKQMEPAVRPLITVCEIQDKYVVAAEIPGVDIDKRPVFYKGVGRLKGSYIRVGDADEQMNEYEVYSYEAFRKRIKDDTRIVARADIKLFEQDKLQNYLQSVKSDKKNLRNNVSDENIMELMGVTLQNKPTLAGVMAFSEFPQAYFPQLCVTAVVIPGTQMGDTGDDGERFIDNKRITGTISDMLDETMDFIKKNIRTKTVINSDGQRRDKTEYPLIAVREAVLNALVHRDYSIYTENTPISIEIYQDRLEIKSSGGLYGNTSIHALGTTRPETRNAVLANILETLKVTENRYSGIPTMFKECRNAGLPDPEFQVKRGEFIVTFKNNLYDYSINIDKTDIKKAVLEFCKTPRTRKELINFTCKSDYYTMSKIIYPMVNQGLIKLTLPEKPKSSKQKFISVV